MNYRNPLSNGGRDALRVMLPGMRMRNALPAADARHLMTKNVCLEILCMPIQIRFRYGAAGRRGQARHPSQSVAARGLDGSDRIEKGEGLAKRTFRIPLGRNARSRQADESKLMDPYRRHHPLIPPISLQMTGC